MTLDERLATARTALGRGDLATATATAAQATDAHPASVDAWVLRTQVALSARDGTDALAAAARAGALGANPVEVAYYRGCALQAQGDASGALREFERVVAAAPSHVPARIQHLRCLAALGRFEQSGPVALAIARAAPQASRDVLPLALEAARGLVVAGRAPPPLPMPHVPDCAADTLVSFVVCSIDEARFAKLSHSVAAHFEGTPHEVIRIPDAKSMCEGLNRGVDRARGDVIVMCHDDIELIAPQFRRRLLAHLAAHDVVGVAGCTDLSGPAWFWSGPPHIHHWVTHCDADGRPVPILCGARGPLVGRAQALDGVFIAARRSVFDRLRFDAELLDGFHGYDVDFSYRAHRLGLDVAIALDLLIVHDTKRGLFDETYRRYATLLTRKFPGLLRQPEAPPPLFHGLAVDTVEQAVAVYAWLAHWCSRLDAAAARGP